MIIPMLIVLILPNLVGILIGYEYSNYPFKNADTIIVNHDESATAVALVKMIKENETFNVIKESTENSDVEKYIKEGKADCRYHYSRRFFLQYYAWKRS